MEKAELASVVFSMQHKSFPELMASHSERVTLLRCKYACHACMKSSKSGWPHIICAHNKQFSIPCTCQFTPPGQTNMADLRLQVTVKGTHNLTRPAYLALRSSITRIFVQVLRSKQPSGSAPASCRVVAGSRRCVHGGVALTPASHVIARVRSAASTYMHARKSASSRSVDLKHAGAQTCPHTFLCPNTSTSSQAILSFRVHVQARSISPRAASARSIAKQVGCMSRIAPAT